jgi:hypothetical protein
MVWISFPPKPIPVEVIEDAGTVERQEPQFSMCGSDFRDKAFPRSVLSPGRWAIRRTATVRTGYWGPSVAAAVAKCRRAH